MKISIRKTWGNLKPITKIRGSKKIYSRKKKVDREDY